MNLVYCLNILRTKKLYFKNYPNPNKIVMMELDPYSDNYNIFELEYADYGFKKHETIPNENIE